MPAALHETCRHLLSNPDSSTGAFRCALQGKSAVSTLSVHGPVEVVNHDHILDILGAIEQRYRQWRQWCPCQQHCTVQTQCSPVSSHAHTPSASTLGSTLQQLLLQHMLLNCSQPRVQCGTCLEHLLSKLQQQPLTALPKVRYAQEVGSIKDALTTPASTQITKMC